jgi:hypothetical protein
MKEARHVGFHAGIAARENVVSTVAINIHNLWSRAGASPHAGHFGDLALGLEPVACRELSVAKIFVDPNLSLAELSNEQVLLAIAIDVSPTGRGVTGRFDPDWHTIGFEADGRLKFSGATSAKPANHQQCPEQ